MVLQGGGKGARHSLTAPHVVLGRLDPFESPAFGNLLFPEPTVSRVHATLDWDESANRYLLTHRSATNPTLVNKAKVSKPRHIAPGDKIQMGNLILEIRVGIGQHAEIELETVDFTALTKQAANQVYRPETVMPEPPAVPAASPQPPREAPAPIPAPIPPPARRQLPSPVFNEPYAPVDVAASAVRVCASGPFFDGPEADEQVSVVQEAPRRIQLSSLPRREEPSVEEASTDSGATHILPIGLFPAISKLPPETELNAPEPVPSHAEEGRQATPVETDPESQPDFRQTDEELQPLSGESSSTELMPTEAEFEKAAPTQDAAEEKPKARPFRRKTPKVGRNQKCPCGSDKKFKKCCGK